MCCPRRKQESNKNIKALRRELRGLPKKKRKSKPKAKQPNIGGLLNTKQPKITGSKTFKPKTTAVRLES